MENMLSVLYQIFYSTILTIVLIFCLHRYYILFMYFKNKHKTPVPLKFFDELPHITVQLPVFNEKAVVKRLIESVIKLDYPRELLEIQVLDDSTDETTEMARALVTQYALQGFHIHLIHRTDRSGFKAGALAQGMNICKGEFILVLDADFVVNPDMLRKTIHFFTNPKIGMVQIRWEHINREFSLLTQLQSILLDGHFVIEHTARNRAGLFFNFNGTAGIWRKDAIISAGGWQADTLTEDLDISYRAQLKGWKFIYLKDDVAPAELPIEMNAFKSQQHRWAKGSIQTALKLLPTIWRSAFPLSIKLEATFHLAHNFCSILVLFLLIVMLPSLSHRVHQNWIKMALMDLPIILITMLSFSSFYAASQREIFKNWWTRIMYLPLVTGLGTGLLVNNVRATIEAMLGNDSPFIRTPKYGVAKNRTSGIKAFYKGNKNFWALVEVFVGGYFTVLSIVALANQSYVLVPFFIIFQLAFYYVGILSLLENWGFSFRSLILSHEVN